MAYCGNNIPDHPDIAHAMRTGYPRGRKPKPVYCQECGEDITDVEQYEDEHHDYICEHCLLYFHKKEW